VQDLIPLGVLAGFGVVLWLVAQSSQKWWRSGTVWALSALMLFLVYAYASGIVAGLLGYHFLRTLQTADVDSISIGDVTISESGAKDGLSSALHHIQWFTATHGGWAREVPLRIRLKGGEERTFAVGRYLRQSGVVIQGTFHTPWSRRMYDCGFSAELPDVLSSLKIDLPSSM
jgi:hypothetical protein